MSTIKVHAGDFLKGDSQFNFGSFSLKTDKHSFIGETIPATYLETVEIATEERVKKIGGTIGWGAVGGCVS